MDRLVASLALARTRGARSRARRSFDRDEGLRFSIASAYGRFSRGFCSRTLDELALLFDATGVCWAPYRTVLEAAKSGDRFGFVAPEDEQRRPPQNQPPYPTPGAAAA